MNDLEIKEIIKKDSGIPNKPVNEWGMILDRIEKEEKAGFFFSPKFVGVFCSMAIALVITFGAHTWYSRTLSYDYEVTTVLEESYSYFEEEEDYI